MNTAPVFIELPSAPMQDIYRTIRQLVGSDISFFIAGETGVGKEGIARYIHENGPRWDKPLVAINCGRFTAELLVTLPRLASRNTQHWLKQLRRWGLMPEPLKYMHAGTWIQRTIP